MDKLKWGLVLQSFLLLMSWIGEDAASAAAAAADSSIEEYLADQENKVRLLASDALRLALDRQDCGLSQCSRTCARHACTPTANDNFTCAATRGPVPDCRNSSCDGIKLDFGGNGFVRLPPFYRNASSSNLSSEIKRSICAYSTLRFDGSIADRPSLSVALSSTEGVYRAYPGRAANPDGDCYNFDPRKQPWYILSTSVVKDLVVLLDTGQQENATFTAATNVVAELFDTFTTADSVNVVTFDSVRATILQPMSVLARSSADLHSSFNVASLVNNPNGFSNLSQGLEEAMTNFNSSSKLKMIVVVTDGYFSTSGNLSTTALQQAVSRLNSEGVVIFFFSLGPGDGESLPLSDLRAFSCRLNSSVTHVNTDDAVRNPLWAVRPYFDYQATMRFKENATFWTNVYESVNGQGNVSTVSYPVFQNGTLYGVASIDVSVNSSDENIINQKYVDPNVPAIRLPCQLQQVNLSQCTKLVDPGLRPLCDQTMYMGESPASTYKKTLCCDSCANNDSKPWRLYSGLGAIGLFVILLCLIAALVYHCVAARSPVRKMKEDFAKASVSTHLYKYKDLKSVTRGFRVDNKLGEGGIGEVYLGRNKDGSQVAVKKLTNRSRQGKREFLTEVTNMSKVQHQNLVKLCGFCVERKHRLLVYEYLEKKSLRQTLLGSVEESEYIDWPTRLKIATQTARGLQYLHDELQPQIIHGDIKASNVLLNSNLDAKISDCGLVKLCPDDKTNFTTNLAGTMGYMAPEYIMRGQLTEKVDVFSYGILLMEIVTGKITTTRSRSGTMCFLLDEIRSAYLRASETSDDELLLRNVDARLAGKFDRAGVVRLFKVALLCTTDSPSIRPPISQVILLLEGSQDIPDHLLQDFGTRGDNNARISSAQASPDLSNLQWWEDDNLDPPLLVERPPVPNRGGPAAPDLS